MSVWSKTKSFLPRQEAFLLYTLPKRRILRYNTDICKERDENWIKFISGERPLDEFDDFVKDLEKIGLKEMLEIKQAAFDAYMAR